MDSEDTLSKSKKIRIYPTTNQRAILKRWVGVQRLVYNKTIDYLNLIEGNTPHWMEIKKEILSELPEFCKETPYQIKSIAVRDAWQSLRTNKLKTKRTGQRFTLRFKSRKSPVQSCFIPKSAIRKHGIYPRILGKLAYSENLPDIPCDSRLVYHNGRYYMTVPYKVNQTYGEKQATVCSIDPGVRSFITFYADNSFGHIGQYDIGRIQRLCEHLDDLISRMSKATSKQKQKMKKAVHRMRWKIRDLIEELHHKVAHFLVDNFDMILLPTFETQQMSKRSKRKIRSKTVRQMLTWGHYRFKIYLKHKAFECGKVVIDVNEAYTSKTNSFTGEVKNIGGAKKIRLGNKWVDRDLNSARGILIRFLIEHPLALGDSPTS